MVELRQMVRIINADVLGTRSVKMALSDIYGVGYSFSCAVCNSLKLDHNRKVGSLSNDEVKKIEDIIKNPKNYNIPSYLYNRQRDSETGSDRHIVTSDLKLIHEFDIKHFKKIKSYRGIRHALGLPVRGQKTRSNFRKGKAIGVSKKKTKQGATKKPIEQDKKK